MQHHRPAGAITRVIGYGRFSRGYSGKGGRWRRCKELPCAGSRPHGPGRRRNYARRYWAFILPAALVVAAVILFPWVFTLFMSVQDWHVGGERSFAGLANYSRMLADDRFQWAMLRTLYFTAFSVLLPVIFGVAAAVCFQRQFLGRGLARTIFIMPMMATPVAIALVWTMMFHPAARRAELPADQRGAAAIVLGV